MDVGSENGYKKIRISWSGPVLTKFDKVFCGLSIFFPPRHASSVYPGSLGRLVQNLVSSGRSNLTKVNRKKFGSVRFLLSLVSKIFTEVFYFTVSSVKYSVQIE